MGARCLGLGAEWEGKQGSVFDDTAFQFGKMKKFWRWAVVMVVEKCDSTQCQRTILKKDQNGNFYVIYILLQLKKFKKCPQASSRSSPPPPPPTEATTALASVTDTHCTCYKRHVNETTQHVLFCSWLLSLSRMSLKCICVVVCISSFFVCLFGFAE